MYRILFVMGTTSDYLTSSSCYFRRHEKLPGAELCAAVVVPVHGEKCLTIVRLMCHVDEGSL
jgi:hypothetical protein